MILHSVYLQHFRNYANQKFDFSDFLTIVIGQNTAGKTNLSEAMHLLATGKSFRTSSDVDMIEFSQEIARVQGLLISKESDRPQETSRQVRKDKIEVVVARPQVTGGRFRKKFLLNGVGKSRSSLLGLLPLVLFRPEELDIIIDGLSPRREFLDEVLEQVDKSYTTAKTNYDRALRQRNALLRLAQENRSSVLPDRQSGSGRVENLRAQFTYWNKVLIENGQVITKQREAFLDYINHAEQAVFPLQTVYDRSTISPERLEQYQAAETAAGITLVGPHRDDFIIQMQAQLSSVSGSTDTNIFPKGEGDQKEIGCVDIRHFGSRGQQRLAVLQLKMLQITYVKEKLTIAPIFILDDILSELDDNHIQLVLQKVKGMQVILTTTHKEFIPVSILDHATVIELGK